MLHRVLDDFEWHIADSGHRSLVDGQERTPTGAHDFYDRRMETVRAMHETVNQRFFCVLSQRCLHPLSNHGKVVLAIARVVQIAISNGNNFFDAECYD